MTASSEHDQPLLFDDGKAPDALRTIGEVAKALGIRAHVLRYWEEQLPEFQPVKRSGGRRYYRPEDVALIAGIHRLVQHEGYTLKGAFKALSQRSGTGSGQAERTEMSAVPLGSDLVASLRAVRDRLAEALAAT